ncbi:hypothetical protein I0C86_35865 [Plantactinospora sp. S1510]|uniref:Flavin reductase n=2 Tax=Plantactinospora alkalitolerans TaxID=2789879 RepID=A0ABS0H720_9ACTN|nr:hypothetical protein [Plantactinospora alkalitolerans]
MTSPRPHSRFRPHTPTRPTFRCRTCGAAWPCSPARLSLLVAYRGDPLGLLTYLSAQLHRARHDLPHLDPAGLSARFLDWVPRQPR